MYRNFFKRAFDIAFSLTAIVALSPLLALTALLIWVEDRGPVFFIQDRVGKGGGLFRVLKFRSMPVGAANLESAQARALVPTRIGKFIRRTSIDELPNLFSILKGDMSLVGPRPPLPTQEGLCALRRQNGALTVKPGLTGLAQIKGYDGMPDDEKAGYDGQYAATVSFLNDVKIILLTFPYLTRKPPVY
jgi:O-antigen biosynthesis protein WbqP